MNWKKRKKLNKLAKRHGLIHGYEYKIFIREKVIKIGYKNRTEQLLHTYCEEVIEPMKDILSDDVMTELRQIAEETINEFLERPSNESNPIANIDFSQISNYHKHGG